MLRGALVLVILFLNLCLWGLPIVAFSFVKFVLPQGQARRRLILFLASLAERWGAGNHRIFDWFLDVDWDIEGLGETRYDGRYLLISNHSSWVDIFAIMRAFQHKTALVRFFLKSELIWLPIVGQACWALEFPFMKRYTPEELEKHPEKRGKDLETTRLACRRFQAIPVTIVNFVEGTRFKREKHAEQQSPYRHLLRPRIGGIAFVVSSMGAMLDAMFDVTITYPGADVTFWRFITGRVPRVVVRIRTIRIPDEFFATNITEAGPDRERFKAWMSRLWEEKDALLDELPGAPQPAARG
ncbi:MAG TPA: acyltransferase [Thermoanaerobaculia bacterium]